MTYLKFGVAYILLLVAFVALAFCTIPHVTAQTNQMAKCGKYDDIKKVLKSRYEEATIFKGFSTNEQFVFEIFSSDNGSWTVLRVDRNLTACVMAAGNHFEVVGSGE